ncbi:hypothetical protein NA57DRAFT_60521 [Rhizodiscina lignyota]|uniref:Uncharacterized protein n=1 Tax=Rhizodiscina lignyota TaxID=1504668 RepID=A0A9P4M2F8_9PEZI|nr:hypothetical protein NA57DRAFT_60521 [Rhizodiscina lignyota]
MERDLQLQSGIAARREGGEGEEVEESRVVRKSTRQGGSFGLPWRVSERGESSASRPYKMQMLRCPGRRTLPPSTLASDVAYAQYRAVEPFRSGEFLGNRDRRAAKYPRTIRHNSCSPAMRGAGASLKLDSFRALDQAGVSRQQAAAVSSGIVAAPSNTQRSPPLSLQICS